MTYSTSARLPIASQRPPPHHQLSAANTRPAYVYVDERHKRILGKLYHQREHAMVMMAAEKRARS